MGFNEQQEYFEKWIDENFISVYDFIHNEMEKQHLSFQEACSYLLTIIDSLIRKQPDDEYRCLFCCKLPLTRPYETYSLEYVHTDDLMNAIRFAVKRNQFRSENTAKKLGLLKEEIQNAFSKSKENHKKKEENKYNDSERNTHLQMIAILAEELAKAKGGKYIKSSGLPNNLQIAELLGTLAKNIEIEALTAKSVETYRKRLSEISQFYQGV